MSINRGGIFPPSKTSYGAVDISDDSAHGNGGNGVGRSNSNGHGRSEKNQGIKVVVKQDWEVLAEGEKWESKLFYPGTPWTETFDVILVGFMFAWSICLLATTYFILPQMLLDPGRYSTFWSFQLIKLGFMLFVAFLGGLIVLNYHIKVNYTRKIQHFCAYLIPLLMEGGGSSQSLESTASKQLLAWWGYWFTLMSFAVFVSPVRNRIRVLDIMFASLDRPEDRPNTLYWITTQIFMGYIVLSAFKWYCDYSGQVVLKSLVFIPVFVTGIGDGLAEPIGIAWGRHKYETRGFGADRDKVYTRSYEGSACVFIVGVISCAVFYGQFNNWLQFVLAITLVPTLMTLAEAFSPHTWDTPFLLLTGCGILWALTFVNI